MLEQDDSAQESGQEIDNVKALVESCLALKETEVLPVVDTLAQAWGRLITSCLLAQQLP
jgi:hypothetical protein